MKNRLTMNSPPTMRTRSAYSMGEHQFHARLVRVLREKLEPIVLGDRTEADGAREGRNFVQSTWGKGADHKLLPLPPASIPA